MKIDPGVEARLFQAFAEPMTVRERAFLDARLGALMERAPGTRSFFGSRLTRSLALAAGLLILVPTVYAIGASLLGEAPYGTGNAAQYEAEVSAAKQVTPLPPGASWPPYLDRGSDPRASYGTGLGWQMVEMGASCSWFEYWLDQQAAGTAATRASALAGVQEMRTWRTFTDVNTTDKGLRDHFQALVASAERGDPQPIREYVTQNCR